MTKKQIKERVKHAYEMKNSTTGTTVVFQVYADSIYILDTEEDNVISIEDTEQDAIDTCIGINSGEFSEDGAKSNCYYKPILIDTNTGERINRKNFDKYIKLTN